jgi:hypothetical protein
VPHDAGLANFEAGTPRHHEQLDIEREPLDRHPRKQGVGRLRAEQLEAALRIRDAPQHQQPHVTVEDASDRVAQPMLADALRARGLARPDHDMWRRAVTDDTDEAIQVVGRHRQVGVRHEPPRSTRLQHSALDRGTLPSTAAPDQPDTRVRGGMPLHHRARPVITPVVDDDDLPGEAELIQMVAQVAQAPCDGAFFVECGNHDREVRLRCCATGRD